MLLFGYRKLPDASRSLGRSLRIFKGEMNGLRGDPGPTREAASGEEQAAIPGSAPEADSSRDLRPSGIVPPARTRGEGAAARESPRGGLADAGPGAVRPQLSGRVAGNTRSDAGRWRVPAGW
ncbi:twin-arginine translocase TatA/TatE family subunit [Geodermatophilus nigrescens]